jgi:hypothetical protein
LLGQAIPGTAEWQSQIQKIGDDELDTYYFKRRDISREAPHYSETVKTPWDEKEEASRRTADET